MRDQILACIYMFVKDVQDSPISVELIAAGTDFKTSEVKAVFVELREAGYLKRKHYFSHVYRLTEEGFSEVQKGYNRYLTLQNETIPALNLLLAEDDLDDALIFEMALNEQPRKYLLRHVVDGNKLFIELQKLIPDLLFLDINMPCKDGLNCIVEIRQNNRYDNMPVVMITSSNNENHIDIAYSAGANLFVVKPASINTLSKKLEEIFNINWKNFMYYPAKKDFVLN
jgi:PleD family two-component response regulator